MKKIFYFSIGFILTFILTIPVFAQGVGINTTGSAADPSAILDVSTSPSGPYLGMLIPRMTTANRNNITNPAVGLLVFNTDCGINEYYTGTCWISMNQVLKGPGQIICSGTTDFCANETRTFTIPTVTGATNYIWSVPAGATITLGQGTISASVLFGNNSGQVCVRAENLCEMSQNICIDIHINPVPPTPGNITGPTTAVPGTSANYFIASVSGAGVYNWTVPAGATITSGVGTTTIAVNFSCSAVSGNISVSAQSNCGTSSPNALTITVTPVSANAGTSVTTPGTLGGSPTASGGTTPYTYAWVPSTSLSSTTVANPTTTVCTTTSYTVIVTDAKGCTASSSVTANMVNPVIANAGPAITSPGTLGGLPTAAGGTSPYSYAWVPSTNLSNTTVANPTTTVCNATTYTVTVTDANGCTSSSSATATSNPVPATPGTITGSTSPACNSTGNAYSISAVTYATTYTWTGPSGAIITSGQGTPSITVSFSGSSGNISVTAGNNCGTSAARTLAVNITGGGSGSQAFNFTGGVQTFTVPSCVTSVTIDARGAQGIDGSTSGFTTTGGLGGRAAGALAVTPGQVLNIYVGGNNSGWNGGGQGGIGKGGDASDVRVGGTALTDRVIVAGGGGGACYLNGNGNGGAGGGTNGTAGTNSTINSSFTGGGGGTQFAGGTAGVGTDWPGLAGSFGQGAACSGNSAGAGGGGGGGYYGGGSGGSNVGSGGYKAGGGGGGSSYIGGVTGGSTTSGVQSGSGVITISW